MNHRSIFLIALVVTAVHHGTRAQDAAESEAESTARSVISDPRFQNMLRSAKKDPEATAKSLQENSDELVRNATRLFQEKKEGGDSKGIDTPENRSKVEKLGQAAMAKVKELKKDSKSSKDSKEPKADQAEVPATRSAAGATRFVTPIAMPVEDTPTPLAATGAGETVVQEEVVPPLESAAPTVAQIPDSPALTEGEIPEPKPLVPKYNTKAGGGYQGADSKHMQITSRESTMDNNKGLLTFMGNVVVDHPEFEIKCEKLEIHMAKGVGNGKKKSSGDSFKRAIASGGMVEIRRISPEGKTQIAMARRADYDAVTKDIILSGGPPYIQDGDSYVKTSSPDAKIIMRGTGKYEITGSDAGPKGRTHIVIPVDGENKTEGIGIQGLGGGIDRLR